MAGELDANELAVAVLILDDELYFYNIPPKKLLKKLKELGLVFEERLIPCG